MDTRQFLLLSTLFLTLGVTQAPAQGFLNKLKNKGTQLVKKAAKSVAPEPVKDVMNSVDRANAKVRGAKNRAQQRTVKARADYAASFSPGTKVITIKFCEGVGHKTWYGRVGGVSPQPPAQCPKQPAWFRALPQLWDLNNARLVQERSMMNKWLADGKPSCEPVLVRREGLDSEFSDRVDGVNRAVESILANDPEEWEAFAEALGNFGFKKALNSDLTPLYPYLEDKVVAWLKGIDRKTKTLDVKVYSGGSGSAVHMQVGEMWFKVNTQRQNAELEELDMDQSVGKDYTVPSTITYGGRTFKVTSIADNAFSDLKIRSVTLSEGLTKIGAQAFARTNLTSINIPSTVTTIGNRAFAEMPQLKSITIPENVKKMGVSMFCLDKALTTVTLPSQLNDMGNSMFLLCSSLTKVTLPQNITKLPQSTFEDCKALTHVDLPAGITLIDQNAFKNTAISQVPLTPALKTIESGAFEGCSRITSVSIPSGVVIEFAAFKNCKNLRKAAIGKEYKDQFYDVPDMFQGCPLISPNATKAPAGLTFN